MLEVHRLSHPADDILRRAGDYRIKADFPIRTVAEVLLASPSSRDQNI